MMENTQDASESGLRDDTNAHISSVLGCGAEDRERKMWIEREGEERAITNSTLLFLFFFSFDVGNDLSWSQEAPMLQKQLNNSRNKEVFTEIQFLLSFFRDLRLVDLKISHTDSLLSLLTSLTSLSLSGNHLSLLSHLPPSLLILNACANNILLLPDAVPPFCNI